MKDKLLTLKFEAKKQLTKLLMAPLRLLHDSCRCKHISLVHGYDGCNMCDCTYFEKPGAPPINTKHKNFLDLN